MSYGEDYSLHKIKDEYISIRNSKFYKIYKEFDKPCKEYMYDNENSCYKARLVDSSISDNVISLLKDLYSNLYRVYYTSENKTNDYFDDDSITE
ncbi:hypothetical protein PVMG_06085, partial [Plasmodium vivax Mauritania I]